MIRKIRKIILIMGAFMLVGCASRDKILSESDSSVPISSVSVSDSSKSVVSSEGEEEIWLTREDIVNDKNSNWKIKDIFLPENPTESQRYNQVLKIYNEHLKELVYRPRQSLVHGDYCIFGYCIYDITADGLPELFVNAGYEYTTRIYSCVNGKIEFVFDRHIMASILKNGIILNGDKNDKRCEVAIINPDCTYDIIGFQRGWTGEDNTETYWINHEEVSKDEYERRIAEYYSQDETDYLDLEFIPALEKTE